MTIDKHLDPNKINHRGISAGSNLFGWRKDASKELTKEKQKQNLFGNTLVFKLLNNDKYRKGEYIPKHQLQARKQIIAMGAKVSDMEKKTEKGVTKFYLKEQAVLVVFRHYHNKGRINDYNEQEVLKELKEMPF